MVDDEICPLAVFIHVTLGRAPYGMFILSFLIIKNICRLFVQIKRLFAQINFICTNKCLFAQINFICTNKRLFVQINRLFVQIKRLFVQIKFICANKSFICANKIYLCK